MKLKHILLLTFLPVLFASCASTKSEKPIDPNYIADLNPIELEDIMCIRTSFGNLKPTELEAYFIPRTNIVEIYFKDGLNKFCILFESHEREALFAGIDMYGEDIIKFKEGDTSVLEEREPTRKNYYTTSTMSVSWGVMGLSRNAITDLYTNYEYIEKDKPYFLLKVDSGEDLKETGAYSPAIELYFSQPHLEHLYEIMSQDALQALVDAKIEEAFAF